MAVRSVLLAVTLVAAGTLPALAQDEFKALPPGDGRDVTIKVCSQCHSPEVVAQQQLDIAGWKQIVDTMANNGANATDAEFDQIVKYLATAFPAN